MRDTRVFCDQTDDDEISIKLYSSTLSWVDILTFRPTERKTKNEKDKQQSELYLSTFEYGFWKWAWRTTKPYGANLVRRQTIQRNCCWSRWMHRRWLRWMAIVWAHRMLIILHLMITVLTRFAHRNHHRHRHRPRSRDTRQLAHRWPPLPLAPVPLRHANRPLCH